MQCSCQHFWGTWPWLPANMLIVYPFIVKLNHNELLTYPDKYDQIFFGTVRDAWNMGAAAVGATIYFGSAESDRQITEVAKAFDEAHQSRHGNRFMVLPAK